jgi:putative endopeptidase
MKSLRYGAIVAGTLLVSGLSTQYVLGDPQLVSGVDMKAIDNSVRAQDDFYRHANGLWLANTQIPPDKGRYDSISEVMDAVQQQLKAIVENLDKSPENQDSDVREVADLYASFMDVKTLERKGLHALDGELARISNVTDKDQIASLVAHFNRIGVAAPFAPQVHQDAKDAGQYVFDLAQGGLGLPDRGYYLESGAQLVHARALYQQHVKTVLALAGDPHAAIGARKIVALERALAKVQWAEVDNRDPAKTYNRIKVNGLGRMAPTFAWKTYLADSGVADKATYLSVSQPTYLSAFDKILARTPLADWKLYFRWHLLSDLAPYLNSQMADEHFAFYGAVLRGAQQNKPRWQLGVDLLNQEMGEALGKAYVARYFPPEAKSYMEHLVSRLLAAYREDIDTLDWMGPETRARAQEKLAKIQTKIGYPARWRDYGALKIARNDLLGNALRSNESEYERNLNKLGKPVDRAEWAMLPQTINAHYDAELNDITFPAAILQPPIVNLLADDAVNYGTIGFTIAHEISHGFDDEGSLYGGSGMLLTPPGWFTQIDLDKFKAKTRALVAQYSAFAPVTGYPVNGEFTLGENIADVSGLAIAYKAYKMSLGGQDGPVIHGLTGDQRFFMGFARVFRGKTRENEAIMRIKADPHAPEEVRGTVPEMNFTPFYRAFGVSEGDKMFLAPDKRVTVW